MTEVTQEQLDQDYGSYATVTLNEDKSATFVMSKTLYAAFLEITGTELTNQLNAAVGTSEFPNVTAIECNDNFTEFNLITTAIETSEQESLSTLYVYMMGKLYNIFNQTEENTITVNFINADSKGIIYTSDSAQMEELLSSVQ